MEADAETVGIWEGMVGSVMKLTGVVAEETVEVCRKIYRFIDWKKTFHCEEY